MKKTGNEPITNAGKSTGYTICDFWSWSASNILDNTLRGEYAEFIVATALELDLTQERTNWEAWDLTYLFEDKPIRIEVKSSSYLQAWPQKKPSIIQFDIRPTLHPESDSNNENNAYRHSDVYVFCVYTEKNLDTANPLQLDKWDFYIIATDELDKQLGLQKTIRFEPLKKLKHIKSDYSGIKSAVQNCFKNTKSSPEYKSPK